MPPWIPTLLQLILRLPSIPADGAPDDATVVEVVDVELVLVVVLEVEVVGLVLGGVVVVVVVGGVFGLGPGIPPRASSSDIKALRVVRPLPAEHPEIAT